MIVISDFEHESNTKMTQRPEILVLDDEHQAADLLATVLRFYFPNALVHVVYSGEDAVAAGKARPLSAAVLDLEMPGLGGEDAARELRSILGDSRPLLIALSGNVLQLSEFRTKGPFDILLSKPVDIQALAEALETHFGKQPPEKPVAP